jgi:hypothetical protein
MSTTGTVAPSPICRIDLDQMQICTTSAAWSGLDLVMPGSRQLLAALHPEDRNDFTTFLNDAPTVPATSPARTVVRMMASSGWRPTKIAALRLDGLVDGPEIMIRLA